MEHLEQKLLLDNPEQRDQEKLVEEFMKLYGTRVPDDQPPQSGNANYNVVQPSPEFCIKTKSENDSKVFINICTADHIPPPKEITDEELLALLDSEDPSQYRVPMSLGEPHAEVDKSGNGCTAYDIVVNQTFCDKLKNNNLFMGFFMSIIMEGIDNKYNVRLSREWIKLKNKKCMGKVLQQHIRTTSKPWIMEIDENTASKRENIVSESSKPAKPVVKAKEPKYKIVQEPVTGHPEFLVAEIHVPDVRSSQALLLDIGEDCIRLDSRSKTYFLEIYLPFDLLQEECGAQFDKRTGVLTVTMPVQPTSK